MANNLRIYTGDDRDGKPVACIMIDGIIFTTSANTTEQALAIAQHAIDVLMMFRDCDAEITDNSKKPGGN